MLKLPAFRQLEDATVFQDDGEFNRFYIIPGFPSLRRNAARDPVLLLIKYAFSDRSRAENPDLPRGGGYLAFDAELAIGSTRRGEIVAELQTWVNGEWERLKSLPAGGAHVIAMSATLPESNVSDMWTNSDVGFTGRAAPPTQDNEVEATLTLPGHDDFTPPPPDAPAPVVVIGEPLWKAGKVHLNVPQSEGLVVAAQREAPASLVGDNVAAFSVDLTEDGATFMQRTLLDDAGAGATDLSPLQVVYELTMLASLPPARALIKYDAMEVYKELHELWHEKCTGCGDDFFTSESTMTQAIKAGLVTVKVNTQGITDEELKAMIIDQAMTTAREIVVANFAEVIDRPDGPPEEWAEDTGLSDEIAIVMAEEEVYRLKQQSQVAMQSFEQTIEVATSVEHTIAPQGTLEPFFADYSATEMKRFVREVDLDDDFFKTLGLSARAFAKWEQDDIAFVEVEVQYGERDDMITNTFTFTAADTEPQQWDPGLIDGERGYKWRWRVGFNGREAEEWSTLMDSTNRDLNVNIATPGKIDVEVHGAGLDFDAVLDAVLVHLRYADSDNDVEMGGTTLLLTADVRSGRWERMIYAPWDKPVEYAFEYLLKDGSMFRTGWQPTEGPQPRLVAPPPQVDVLDVSVVPAGLWSGVIQTVVDLRYEDSGNDYNKDITYQLTTPAEFRTWSVLLRDPEQRDFEYKVISTFENGDVAESGWLKRSGDQTVPVEVAGPPRLQVKIVGRVVDYEQTRTVQVTLRHAGDAEHGDRTESFVLEPQATEHVWDIPLSDANNNRYRYQLKYFPDEIDPVETDWVTSADNRIIPPRYDVPRVGAKVVPAMVNFTETPVVEVEMKYGDPQRDVSETQTLVFTSNEAQEWFLSVAAEAPRLYTLSFRYHLADGEVVASPPTRTESTAVIIPRYRPAE